MGERFPAKLPVKIRDLLTDSHISGHFRKQALPVEAVPTPLPKWNDLCGDQGGKVGLAKGWHITVGANTGAGKTLMGLNLSAHAIKYGHSVGYINLEMSIEQMSSRLYSMLTNTPIRHIEPGHSFQPDAEQTIRERVAEIVTDAKDENLCFLTNDAGLHAVDSITGLMSYMHEMYGIEFFVVDYIQRVRSRYEDMLKQVTDVSLKVSDFAKEKNVTTIALSQFNRETSKDYQNPPRSQGLMGGSPLENDSDQVVLLDHSKFKPYSIVDSGEYEKHFANTYLIIDKNRHGGQGVVPILWDYTNLRVSERIPDDDE